MNKFDFKYNWTGWQVNNNNIYRILAFDYIQRYNITNYVFIRRQIPIPVNEYPAFEYCLTMYTRTECLNSLKIQSEYSKYKTELRLRYGLNSLQNPKSNPIIE